MLIDEIFRELAEKIIAVMQDNIRNKPIKRRTESKGQFESVVNASGDLANSLTYQIDGYTLNILANEYWRSVVYGQEPGEIPEVGKIAEWMQNKGVKGSPQRIAMNIGYYGNSIFQEFNGEDSGLFAEAVDASIFEEFQQKLALEIISGITQQAA